MHDQRAPLGYERISDADVRAMRRLHNLISVGFPEFARGTLSRHASRP
jgi:hypothetical protein